MPFTLIPKEHRVNINRFIPVFLGGINVGSGSSPHHHLPDQTNTQDSSKRYIDGNIGNKPPWTLPAKAAYSKYDGKRAQRYFGHDFEIPSFFPILSLLVCLSGIQSTHFSLSFLSFQGVGYCVMWWTKIRSNAVTAPTSTNVRKNHPRRIQIPSGLSIHLQDHVVRTHRCLDAGESCNRPA